MLNASLLSDYCEKFFGFGRWTAPIWFVGIEEAGGHDEAEVKLRLETWAARGRLDLEDAPSFYPACGNTAWHGPEAKPQTTWQQLIRMALRARGEKDTDSALLDHQQQLGSANGETCVVELLPLPSPGTGTWNYKSWSELPWANSREAYFHAMRQKRMQMLKERLRGNSPHFVVFYGTTLSEQISLLPTWSRIAGGDFHQAVAGRKLFLERTCGKTPCFVTKHPGAKDIRPNGDTYFREVGDILKVKLGIPGSARQPKF